MLTMQYGGVARDGVVFVSYAFFWRSVDNQTRRALYTHAGYRDKLPDRLLALAGVREVCLNLCIGCVHPSWIDKHRR